MSDDHITDQTGGRSGGTDPLGSERAPVTPSVDLVFEVLADEMRREICLLLLKSETATVTLADLSVALTDDGSQRDQLEIDLHHRHLPKLADAGIIDYDARSNTVRYWGQPTVEKWVEHVQTIDQRTDQRRA